MYQQPFFDELRKTAGVKSKAWQMAKAHPILTPLGLFGLASLLRDPVGGGVQRFGAWTYGLGGKIKGDQR